MNSFELVVASTFLRYFPDDIDYSTLINRLNNDELGDEYDAIEFWNPFDYYPGVFIAECIETLHNRLVKAFHTLT